jgi:ABC-type polysaccharide/polyol phosphate export permease
VSRHLPGSLFLRNLVERRSLLFQLVRRDFEQRFIGSAIGWVWGLIHPLVLLLCYTFVFSVCMGSRLGPGAVTTNYPMFIFAGLLPWLLFSDTVQRSASSLVEQANLITKTVFPAEIVPVSIFLSSLVSHVMALFLAVAAAGIWLRQVSPALLLLPLYMAVLGLFAIGIGWIMAALQVYLRDTAQILAVILTFWFWMTPIFIQEQQIPAPLHFLVVVNPLAYVVRAYQVLLLSPGLPSFHDALVVSLASFGTFCLGGLFFRHMKRGFADVL